MKKLKSILAICLLVMMLSSCEDTGDVVFRNRSVTNTTYNVVWDGSVIASLYPQQDSDTFEVKEGSHNLRFVSANTGAEGCAESQPSITAGYIETFTCSY